MPRSYAFYDISFMPNLNAGESIDVRWQDALFGGMEAPRTVFKYQRPLVNLPIQVFNVIHEVHHQDEGRANGADFNEYILTHRFPAFYHSLKGLLMLRTKKDVARGAMHTLTKYSDVRGQSRVLDLKSINEYIEHYKGAWFTVANNANVNSQAFFGASIDYDNRFDKAMAEGEIKNIRLDYSFRDRLYHMGISRDYSLVLFDTNLSEQDELELVLDIKEQLLDKAVVKAAGET